jgi:serine protease
MKTRQGFMLIVIVITLFLFILLEPESLFAIDDSTIQQGTVNDPYYPYQFYLHMISTDEAWTLSHGNQDIIVAVIDAGVIAHEDLPSNRIENGYNAFTNTIGDAPPGGNEAHGMAVAGIIAASHNNKGIAGIAPTIKIMPIKIFDYQGRMVGDPGIINAISFAKNNGARIINNSWNYGAGKEPVPELNDSLQSAIEEGIVVVFSSGNFGGEVQYPADIDGVITVGAIDKNNARFGYSATGSQLNLVAPSGEIGNELPKGPCSGQPLIIRREMTGDIWSLDIPGEAGYNPGNYLADCHYQYNEYIWTARQGEPYPAEHYTAHFGETSASAPQVSGVVALMLSINPELTLDQIRTTLHLTADKVSGMGGQNFTNNTATDVSMLTTQCATFMFRRCIHP